METNKPINRFSLSSISKAKMEKPMITIYGMAGAGKTTLAATFPAPIFIRTENGLNSVVDQGVDAFPISYKYQDVLDQLDVLIHEGHEFKTVVIDSVTSLDSFCIEQSLRDAPENQGRGREKIDFSTALAKTLNMSHGKYGGGNEYCGKLHKKIWTKCNYLRTKKDMYIVFIGHARAKEVDLPDQSEKFTCYELDINKSANLHYITNVDLVGYMKPESYVTTNKDGKGKIQSTGQRAMVCHLDLTYVTKNRYGITKEVIIKRGENPLLGLFE